MIDKNYLENYLLMVKSTIEVYVHGTLESSNIEIKEVLWDSLDETLKHQSNTYDELVKNGYYIINNVDSSCINDVINKLENNK